MNISDVVAAQNKLISAHKTNVQDQFKWLNSQLTNLKEENKDLMVNNQLEDIQTNLNEYVFSQKLAKKEEAHTLVIHD